MARQGKRSYRQRPRKVIEVARTEVKRLFGEAKSYHESGQYKLAIRRVKAARRAAMKVQLRIPEFWSKYCRRCNAYLVQGENSTIRIRQGIRILRCEECGAVRRKVMSKIIPKVLELRDAQR